MELPTGYRSRAPRERDAGEIATVVVAHDIADFGEPDFTEHDLLDDWTRPRFDLARDAWVLVGPIGRIVGYAFVWKVEAGEVEGDAFVLPEYGGRGLGGYLLDLVECRAREIAGGAARQPATIGLYASSVNTAKRDLLERRGFRPVHSRLRLKIDLERREPVEPDTITDFEVRVFDPRTDEAPVHAVMDDAFSSQRRYSRRRLDEWLDLRVRHPAYDPKLWRVACATDEVVGAILVYDVGGTGYVSNLGVRRQWQGRGVGQALLLEAFDALRDRGQIRVVVQVDAEDASGARRLYERVGMRVAEQHDWFAKELTWDPAPG